MVNQHSPRSILGINPGLIGTALALGLLVVIGCLVQQTDFTIDVSFQDQLANLMNELTQQTLYHSPEHSF
jgi:hypothetical protein